MVLPFIRRIPSQCDSQVHIPSMVILRAWTGYHEAECFFLTSDASPTSEEELRNFNQNLSSRPTLAPNEPSESEIERASSSRGFSERLHLLIFAPRRSSLLECWEIPLGERVSAFHLDDSDFRSLIPSQAAVVSPLSFHTALEMDGCEVL